MKFAILTDIHLGLEAHFNGVLRKMSKDAKVFLDNFINQMNHKENPDFVVILGDLIEEETEERDKERIKYLVDLFKQLNCPVYYAAGNHDLQKISENELAKLFGYNKLYYSFESNKFHLVVLYSKVFAKDDIRIIEEQMNWLQQDLAKTNKKTILFVHHCLANQDVSGNPWFDGKPEYALIANRKEVREIIEKSGNVIAVFNSHLHWDRMDLHNSIPYFTIQSLIENEENKGIASEAYAIVSVKDECIDVEIKGNYGKKFEHRLSK